MKERPGRQDLRYQGPHELLLPRDPREVRYEITLDVPGSNERQRLPSLEVVATRVRQVEAGQRVGHGLVDADGDAAQRVHHALEP